MTDPTAFKIDFNPTVQRMKGVTLHGSAAFDVPLISEIAPNLWQGGCEDGLILPDFIRHLVSLYPWESYTVRHQLDSALLVRMYDSDDQTFEQIEELARWVNLCRTHRSRAGALPGRAEQIEPHRRPSTDVGGHVRRRRRQDGPREAVAGVPVQPGLRRLPARMRS